MDETDVVDAPGDVRKQLADVHAATSVFAKTPGGGEQGAGRGEGDAGPSRWIGLPVMALQERLVIEGVDVRWAAFHEQEDDPFGAGRKGRPARGERIDGRLGGGGLRQQRGEGEVTEASGACL